MNPDSYIPFYALEFWQAVEGQPDYIVVGYLRAITHYWMHSHCKGLRDDSEYLRKLCRIDPSDWETAQGVIFDNERFFTLGEGGMWQQKRARELWRDTKSAYDRRVKQTSAATLARTKKRRTDGSGDPLSSF